MNETGPTASDPKTVTGLDPSPITAETFDSCLEAVGPFEPSPHIAVAVSGGPDSMALLCLAADWARRRGARVTALTVNHGLRPEAAKEARQVAIWSAALDVEHRELTWRGAKPATGIQAAARAARYRLLTAWCRDNAVAHLLTAHHADDQAETFLYRMNRGSGADGLAAMPAVTVRDGVRLLRPLLPLRRAALVPVLAAAGQTAIDDPSNLDTRFARVEMRGHLAALENEGIGCADVLSVTTALGRLRGDRDRSRAALAATAVAVFPAGYADIDLEPLEKSSAGSAEEIVAAVLHAIGGQTFAPRRRQLSDMVGTLRDGSFAHPRTLGGCVVASAGAKLRVFREPRAIRHQLRLDRDDPDDRLRWDGRFDITLNCENLSGSSNYTLSRLGEAGWQEISGAAAGDFSRALPGPVRFGLPAVFRGEEVAEVPHLRYRRAPETPEIVRTAVFRPDLPVAGPPFRVA